MADTRQFCTFYVDGNCLGLDVTHVQEVLREKTVTRVPLAPPIIGGLINTRGEIGVVVDMRRLLELSGGTDDGGTLITLAGENGVSLLVDQIGDVLEVSEADCEPPPETVQGVARELICGVYKLGDCLLLVLDTQKTMARAQREASGRDASALH